MDDDRRSSENNGEVEVVGKDCSAPLTLSSRMLRGPSFGPARSTASHKLSRTIAIRSMLRRKTLARGEKHEPAEADIRPLTSPAYFFPNRYPVAPQRQLAGLGTRYPDARLGPNTL